MNYNINNMGGGASKKASSSTKGKENVRRSSTVKLTGPFGILTDAQKARTYDVIVIGGGPVGC